MTNITSNFRCSNKEKRKQNTYLNEVTDGQACPYKPIWPQRESKSKTEHYQMLQSKLNYNPTTILIKNTEQKSNAKRITSNKTCMNEKYY